MGFDFDIDSGQLVRVKLNNNTKFVGVCAGNSRNGPIYGNTRRTAYKCTGLKTILSKKQVSATFNTSTSIEYAVESSDIADFTSGITHGDIRTSDLFQEKYIIYGKSISNALDELASLVTAHWFIDNDLKLNFFTT